MGFVFFSFSRVDFDCFLGPGVHRTGMFEHIRNDPFLFLGPEVRPHVVTVIMELTSRTVNASDFPESREVAMMFADILRLPEG